MTTRIANVSYDPQLRAFRSTEKPMKTLSIVHAFADLLFVNGEDWLKTMEAKSLAHTLNMAVHGAAYRLDASKEQHMLEQVFR